ncbi:unnamed protein product [Phaedon cochleariae]|uniref:Uncharacterized protein n=1 Tax=Phaedon cochleariae TaxID=80249 RepID=A0A9P0DH13_PHACE|nr:unnamed protein product [Phaedon cochleariae]
MLLCVCVLTISAFCFIDLSTGEQGTPNFFLTAAKSVPRIGRSNQDTSDFEKFFMKASKSVPRIGRRNDNPHPHDMDMLQNGFKYPTWAEIADRYEYDPELFSNPSFLSKLEEMMGDDPNVYDWEKVRVKRELPKKIHPKLVQKLMYM